MRRTWWLKSLARARAEVGGKSGRKLSDSKSNFCFAVDKWLMMRWRNRLGFGVLAP